MIEGERINLWALERHDLLTNFTWANDPELILNSGMQPFPMSGAELNDWFETSYKSTNTKTFAIKLKNAEYIGNVELSNIEWRIGKAEIGIIIGLKNRRRQGYAKEAVKLLCRFAFDELRFHRLQVKVLDFNTPAIKLFESCGFKKEGVEREGFYCRGKYCDVIDMGILKYEV